uniref:Uncharacterized protein n=1 Tax=Coccidioides posadasii RMSCC 3488 TaxID=454284 RepID=A0A0J6IGN4_COCPO|nr:hypothetical protein CPAG_07299 [Coccidioides posadasii RMSCC 3488]
MSAPSIDAGSSRPVIASPTPINTSSLERQTQPKLEAGKFTTLITLHVRGNPLTESYDSPPTILGISSPEPRIRTIDENVCLYAHQRSSFLQLGRIMCKGWETLPQKSM